MVLTHLYPDLVLFSQKNYNIQTLRVARLGTLVKKGSPILQERV